MAKVFETVKRVFSIVLVIVAVCVMIFTVVSVATFNRNDRNIFGYKAFIVLSDSMKATDFAAGDLVIVKNVDPTTLEVGDIIAYSSQNADNYGETVTHKIRSKTVDANGDNGFITYGTTTNTDDETVVTYPYINGKYIFHLPKVGLFFNFLRTTPGYIICILIPFLLLIGMQGLNTIKLFRQYKREQMEALNSEREKIEAERKQSEEMMAELMKLKAQLAGQGDAPAPAEAEKTEEKTSDAPASPEPAAEDVTAEEVSAAEEVPAAEEVTAEEIPAAEEAADVVTAEEEKPAEAPAAEEAPAEVPAQEEAPAQETEA